MGDNSPGGDALCKMKNLATPHCVNLAVLKIYSKSSFSRMFFILLLLFLVINLSNSQHTVSYEHSDF